MKRQWLKLLQDETAATAIEYGFIVMLVSLAVIAGLIAIGGSVSLFFNNALSGLSR